MICGIGCRRGLDLVLLWLWCRLAGVAPIRPLAWEPPYAMGVALKWQKRQKKKKNAKLSWMFQRLLKETFNLKEMPQPGRHLYGSSTFLLVSRIFILEKLENPAWGASRCFGEWHLEASGSAFYHSKFEGTVRKKKNGTNAWLRAGVQTYIH